MGDFIVNPKMEKSSQRNESVSLSIHKTHLAEMRISQRASGLWVNYDDPDSWKDLSGEDMKGVMQPFLRALRVCGRSVHHTQSLFSQQSILTVPDSMSGRLCGAPRSTSLTLREMDKSWLVNHLVRSRDNCSRLRSGCSL